MTITNCKRGGPGRGQGRKPKSASGEVMKSRAMRWTDAGWSDVLLIGIDRVRQLVADDAALLRTSSEQFAKRK
jgi:hypothetical protein